MEKVTIKQYAIKNKLSIFNVMKMISSKKLKIELVYENDKEVTYILVDKDIKKENFINNDLEEELRILKSELKILEHKIEELEQKYKLIK